MIDILPGSFGRDARHCLGKADDPTADGAVAALESFYYAFNQRSIETLSAVWLNDPLVQLNNPLGGILRGADAIRALYARIFSGPTRVWVELADIVQFQTSDAVVFAGRETGEFAIGRTVVPLEIRTSRVFTYTPGTGWRQVHHHGSIDDPSALAAYQAAVGGDPLPDA